MISKTVNHLHHVVFDSDGNASTDTATRPHAITYPPEAVSPRPRKGPVATGAGANIRFIELRKDKYTLPFNRFLTDTSPRLRNRQPTESGVVPSDALLVEGSVGGDDFILLESDDGSGSPAYIKQE